VAESSRVDDYLAKVLPQQRAALDRLRLQLHRLLPDADETISYGMPAFKIGDRAVVWFAGWKAHCSIYPLTASFLRSHADELKGFRRTKGSLHFTPDKPVPDTLLAALVRERLADVEHESR
jgi:uncharacterized protein YdhG (YjbR/CyaY superfamily)